MCAGLPLRDTTYTETKEGGLVGRDAGVLLLQWRWNLRCYIMSSSLSLPLSLVFSGAGLTVIRMTT